jgi:ribosomal protein S18 acetylase RimI-like enzyme
VDRLWSRASQQIGQALQTSGSPETVLVAEESGVIVGFACLQTLYSVCCDSPRMEITELCVVPARRRSGTGKALVREAIRKVEQVGASDVLLLTNLRNEAAKSLFSQLGLEPAPHVVFRRSIAPA